MNRKIVFIDCDGTLFDVPRGMDTVSKKSIYAVNELVKNGHLVFIASGRCKCLMPKDVIDMNPTGFITANGACAYTNEGTIFCENIKKESIETIYNYCFEHNGICYLESQDFIHVKDLNDPLHIDFVSSWGIDTGVFSQARGDNSFQLMMAAFKTEQECFEFEKAMNNIVDVRRQYGFTSYDISDFGLNKGYGVKKVLEYYGIDKKDAYAFGDGLNDFELLNAAGENYCMENGNPKLKALAKYIAPDVLDDGFYQIMVQDGLIKPID